MSEEFQEIRLKGPSGRLAGKRWTLGPTPVIALHGWLDNAGSFDRLAPYLQGMDVLALDFSGHGYSDRMSVSDTARFVDWVPEVFAAAEALGWQEFALLGHSMGAGVAALAAGTFAQRVTRLVLVEGLGPFTNPDEEAPNLLARALLYRPPQERRVYATRQEALQRLLARGLQPESVECLAARALEHVDGGWAFSYAPQVRAPSRSRLSESQVRAFLRAIVCPTLLVMASDGLPMPATCHGREHEVPNLRTETYAGGHHLHLDYPERVAGVILEHLSRTALAPQMKRAPQMERPQEGS